MRPADRGARQCRDRQIAECEYDILDISMAARSRVLRGKRHFDFVIVGPEAPLAAGVVDRLREAGFLVFGPSRRRPGWKPQNLHQGDLRCLRRPHRRLGAFHRGRRRQGHIAAKARPIVVKADGLAAGKGVVVAMTEAEACAAIDDMFGGAFGAAGAEW
jgi:phosphoribosylamine--glycine ligase